MNELEKLEHLSLVSKICIELDNHLGINDKDLAEFIIDLAAKNTTFESFKKVLTENGADFPDSFIQSLMRIIHLMKPLKKGDGECASTAIGTDRLAMKFPGLAMPNKSQAEMEADVNVADGMLAELEALAPSTSEAGKDIGAKKEHEDRKEDMKTYKDESRAVRKRERSPDRFRHRSRDRIRDHSRDRKRRSGSRDRKRDRRRSRSLDRKRSRSRDRKRERSRSRDRKRERSRSRDKKRERSRSRDRARKHRSGSCDRRRQSPTKTESMAEDPEAGQIYQGRVANITNFGCFVQLMGLRKRWEGLVHISQLRAEGKVNDVTEVVSRGANVRVKVMSVAGQKVSLSMKEVDQTSGRDLNPASHSHLKDDGRGPNAERAGGTSLLQLQGGGENIEEDQTRKRVTRISSPERWEIKQMISSGVIDRSELPDFDEETGLLPKDEDNEADIEIEIVEEEPPFLQGHGRALHDLSPVRIVKNPDGSLAQAAMMQSALAKERREVKMYQREQEMDSIPTSLNKNWIDPLPDGKY